MRRLRVAALMGAALLLVQPQPEARPEAAPEPTPSVATGVPTGVRLFRLRFKSIDEAVGLIRPLLSEDGTLMLEPRRRAITVHDRPERLERVADFIAAWDVPPRNVRLTIQLIRARAVEGGAVRLSQELRGVGEALKDVTRWTDYENVGSVSVTASEGESATLEVSEYRIHLALDQVAESGGSVRLKRFALEKREALPEGGERLRPIWDTVLNLKAEQLTVLGATRLEDSQKAILLTVSASVEK